MSEAFGIRIWSQRHAHLLLAAMVLTGFVGYLVYGNYRAGMAQLTAAEDRTRLDANLHALVLGHFVNEHQGTVDDIAASPDVVAYFENQAMGMSQEYGLRQSLAMIAARLEQLRRRKLLGDAPIFDFLAFHAATGAMLASAPPDIPVGAMPPLGMSTGAGRLIIATPVLHRGIEAGRLSVGICLDRLRRLMGTERNDWRSSTWILDAESHVMLIGDSPPRQMQAEIIAGIRGGHGTAVVRHDDGHRRHIIATTPVLGTPFIVASMNGTERAFGSEPWHGLAFTLTIAILLLGGTGTLILNIERSRRLGALVSELETRGELEQARSRETLVREISARRQAEEQLQQLGHAIEQAAESVMITDANGRIEYVNPAFTAVSGYSRAEAIGQTPRLLNSGRHSREFFAAMWRELTAGRPWSGRLINRRKDGSIVHEDSSISPVRDLDGRIVRYVAVNRDVTSLIRMEEQLRQAQKLESIGQLAAGIAHEINTPIQYIGDNLRFLGAGIQDIGQAMQVLRDIADGRADAEAARTTLEATDIAYLSNELPKAIAQSQDGVERVAEIVRSMKEFSHPDGQNIAPTDINRAISSTVTVARNEWKYVAEVRLNLDPQLPLVPLAAGDFNQVMLNLIVNAAHAIADRRMRTGLGHIDITTSSTAGMVTVTIRDDGCGIPDGIRHRIFEPFFTTKEVGRGTGQGLALARAVITGRMRGSIDFDSEVGTGTRFTIRLPLQPRP